MGNHKTLLKEIKDDANKWKDICVRGLKDLILLRYLYYPKQSTDSTQFLKIPMAFLAEIDKFIRKIKEFQRAKTTFKEKNKGVTLPAFKIYFKDTVIKTV